MTPYPTSCPSCGGPLSPHAGHPDSAPWLCTPCRRGWWPAELTASARALYRQGFGDFGYTADAQAVAVDCERQRQDAHARGTSALPEQLAHLTEEDRSRIASSPLVSATVRAALTGTTTEPAPPA